jgi:hypothetical protein
MRKPTDILYSLLKKHNIQLYIEPTIYGVIAIACIAPLLALPPGQALGALNVMLVLLGILFGNLAITGWRPVTALITIRENKQADAGLDHFLDLVVNNDQSITNTPVRPESRRQAA